MMLGATLSGPVAGISAAVYRDPTYRDSSLAHMNEKNLHEKYGCGEISPKSGPTLLPGWLASI